MSESEGRTDCGLPPLGNVVSQERTCTRTVNGVVGAGEVLCGKPAVTHLDWGPAAGYVCTAHNKEAVTRWKPQAHHRVGPYCGMPGSLWYSCPDGSSYCGYEGDLPTVEPVRAFAVEVGHTTTSDDEQW